MRSLSVIIFLASVLGLSRCATEPGSTGPIAGGSLTRFTYATGEVGVVVSVQYPKVVAAAVLFDLNEAGVRSQATEIEESVTVDWPTSVSFTIPGCGGTASLTEATTYTTFKIFNYDYPSGCAASSAVTGQVSLGVNKTGFPPKTLSGAGSSGSSGGVTHTIFVTAQATTGNIGGIAAADALCAAQAAAGSKTASISGTWKAILSTLAVNAKDRVTLAGDAAILNSQGETVVTQSSNLWGGTLLSAIKYDQDGVAVSGGTATVWTASTAGGLLNGAGSEDFCDDWLSSSGGVYRPYYGSPTATDGLWLNIGGTDPCSSSKRLYCINSQ